MGTTTEHYNTKIASTWPSPTQLNGYSYNPFQVSEQVNVKWACNKNAKYTIWPNAYEHLTIPLISVVPLAVLATSTLQGRLSARFFKWLWGFVHLWTKALMSGEEASLFSRVEVRSLCRPATLANHVLMELALYTGALSYLEKCGPFSSSKEKLLQKHPIWMVN